MMRRMFGGAAATAIGALFVGLSIAGCGGSQSSSPRPERAPLPPETMATPPARPSAVVPEGWGGRFIAHLGLRIALPPEWNEMPVAAMRERITSGLPRTTGDLRRGHVAMVDLIDSGRLRFIAMGPSAIRPWQATVSLMVDTGDASLDAAVVRFERWYTALATPVTRGEDAIALPLGHARRIEYTLNPTGGATTRSITYVTLLEDGTTLMLMGSSRETDVAFPELIATMARSLSR